MAKISTDRNGDRDGWHPEVGDAIDPAAAVAE
jgi:hypothetical protein